MHVNDTAVPRHVFSTITSNVSTVLNLQAISGKQVLDHDNAILFSNAVTYCKWIPPQQVTDLEVEADSVGAHDTCLIEARGYEHFIYQEIVKLSAEICRIFHALNFHHTWKMFMSLCHCIFCSWDGSWYTTCTDEETASNQPRTIEETLAITEVCLATICRGFIGPYYK